MKPHSPKHGIIKRTVSRDLMEAQLKKPFNPKNVDHQVSLDYMMFHSETPDWKQFGSLAPLLEGLSATMEEIDVEIRMTLYDFMWGGGRHALSSAGRCVMASNGGAVFFDVAPHMIGRELNISELMDTVSHECAHATGVALKRWTYDDMPYPVPGSFKFDERYLTEEAIAMTAAKNLVVHHGLRNEQQAQKILEAQLRSLQKNAVRKHIHIPQEHISSAADNAFNLLAYGLTPDQKAGLYGAKAGLAAVKSAFRRVFG